MSTQTNVDQPDDGAVRKHDVTVSINLTVHDPEAFAAAARARALADGLGEEEAASYTADDLGACAVMLFDPGMSPPGSEIQESSAESSVGEVLQVCIEDPPEFILSEGPGDVVPATSRAINFGMAGGAS